jgi:amidase
MLRISREKTVPCNKRYQVRAPVAEVALGETFVVETINFRTPIIRGAADANPEVYREREETGPIFVKGISAGDVLAIHIEDIRPEGHASGPALEGKTYRKDGGEFLPIRDGRVLFPGGLSAPLRMMIGDIYVTPAGWPGGNPWDNGGNMDFKDIAPGNALLLKAILPGGLLVLGDVHAAQGDGEVAGVAAECAAEVTVRITRDETFLPNVPTVIKKGSFVCLGCRPAYHEARDLAVSAAARILARLAGCTEPEARLYVTTVGDLRNGAVWSMGRTAPPWPKWMEHVPLVVGMEAPLPERQA